MTRSMNKTAEKAKEVTESPDQRKFALAQKRAQKYADKIRTARSPDRILDLVELYSSQPFHRVSIYDPDIGKDIYVAHEHHEKVAAIENPNTPTLLLYRFYLYSENSEALKGSALAALDLRGWSLTKHERENLSLREVNFYDDLFNKKRFERMLRREAESTSPADAALSKLSSSLILSQIKRE